jgi:hypothetical protein
MRPDPRFKPTAPQRLREALEWPFVATPAR